jgi:hypothetical protein
MLRHDVRGRALTLLTAEGAAKYAAVVGYAVAQNAQLVGRQAQPAIVPSAPSSPRRSTPRTPPGGWILLARTERRR